jgi:hypothetical protein
MKVTIAIFEVYGTTYDQLFHHTAEKVKKILKQACDTVHIHYIEEVPKQNLTPHPEILTR